jgi:hypothetical protein
VARRRAPQATAAVSRILGTVLGAMFLAMAAAAAPSPAHELPTPPAVVEVVAPPLVVARIPRPVLGISFALAGRVLLLEDDRISLWKLTPDGLTRRGELPAPTPVERTRRPGGLIRAAATSPDFWVLRSGWTEALLFAYEDGANGITWVPKGGAEALPWPSAPSGLRFRPGTNVFQGAVEGLSTVALLALSSDGALGVDADNVLRHSDGGPAVRVGSAVARPWADVAVAAAPALSPPDSLIALPLPLSSAAPMPLAPFDGSIRAVATLTEKDTAVVLVVIQGTDGSHQVLRLDLRRHNGP